MTVFSDSFLNYNTLKENEELYFLRVENRLLIQF